MSEGGAQLSGAGVKPPQLGHQSDLLAKTLDETSAILNNLVGKLSCVSRTASPTPGHGSETVSEELVDSADFVREQRYKVEDLNIRLENLINRLEV